MNNGTEFYDKSQSIPAAFLEQARQNPVSTVYHYGIHESKRIWKSRTYAEVLARVQSISRFLLGLGISKDGKVAIISNTRPEWCESDLAILLAGGTTISIYPSLTARDSGYILYDSGADVVFAENQEQLDKLISLLGQDCPIPETEDRPGIQARITVRAIICFEPVSPHPLVHSFEEIVRHNQESSLTPPPHLNRDSIASIVYTSGTTGAPKGVVQTHGNHLTNVRQAFESGIFGTDGKLFLYLPLAHSFARLVHYIGFLTPASLVFPCITDPKSSKIDLAQVVVDIRCGDAAYLPSVPRLFEKMKSGLEAAAGKRGLQGFLLRTTLQWSQSLYHKRQANTHTLFDILKGWFVAPLRRKIRRQLFGQSFRHAVSGGAKLNRQVNEFFAALDIPIYEGYGLTETCVATNVNLVGRQRIGSVGPAFRDIEVRIASDGEILFRGPNIAKGYYNRPQATAEAWDTEGWFHTGDIGETDDDGFLFITDRKKDLIVTAGGKKVPSAMLEGEMKRCPLISQCIAYGDERPYLVALLTVDEIAAKQWAASEGIAAQGDWSSCKQLRQKLELFFNGMNKNLASFEQIKKFSILPEDFTVENGLLTPTQKPKRKEVIKRYWELIQSMY